MERGRARLGSVLGNLLRINSFKKRHGLGVLLPEVGNNRTANQPPSPAIFPDQLAPVVRVGHDGAHAMEMMRWGFPPPPNLGTRPATNVRNTASPY